MHYNSSDLPFVLELFTDDSGANKKEFKEFWDRHHVPRSINDLISIKEGIQIGIRLFAKEGMEKDVNAKVIIQTSIYDEQGKQSELTVPLTDKENRQYLYTYYDNQEFPWRLGVYLLEVYYQEKVYSSAFFVTPIHLSLAQVQHMHLLLEKEIEGICYELIYTSKSIGDEQHFLKAKTYYDYVLWLINEKERLFTSLSQLERNLLEQVKTEYRLDPFQKKVDHKSLRWKEVHASPFELNKRKVLTVDIPVNQWIKHVLLSWKIELHNIQQEISRDYQEILVTIREKEDQMRREEERKKTLWNERDISQESKDSMRTKIFRLEGEIKKAERQLSILNQWNLLIKDVLARFSFLLSFTPLEGVKRGQKKPALKYQNYRIVTDLYEAGRKILFTEGVSKHIIQILKPTWKIYEQFVYLQVVDMIRKYGFVPRGGFKLDDLQDIHSGFCMELEKENALINVWYDKSIHLREDALASGDNFFSTRVIQPDIRIDLYKKSESEVPIFISCIVLDAKHRRYRSLHNENYTSIVYNQMTKYHHIYYLGENTVHNRRTTVVDSVLCIYSRDREAKIKQEVLPLVFIQFFPDIDQDNILGYKELDNEITHWLDEKFEGYGLY
ncbi:hypothetical protein [Brevibacillus sp. H7]|uniref:hypothetical protein n=1 Tax=Brevibacillus sp. H7 TaxID=3349138 RepID=UPI003822EEE7